jgi:hypothetical protein
VGGYHLYTNGQPANALYAPAEGHVWAMLVDVGVGLAARLGAGAAVSVDLHAFATQPGARVGMGEGDEGTFIGPAGRPSFVGSLGLLSSF